MKSRSFVLAVALPDLEGLAPCLNLRFYVDQLGLIIVKPETVVSWHRKGFRLFWTWISRSERGGRPETSPEIRTLIRKMA